VSAIIPGRTQVHLMNRDRHAGEGAHSVFRSVRGSIVAAPEY
jgi:hypothetical protein